LRVGKLAIERTCSERVNSLSRVLSRRVMSVFNGIDKAQDFQFFCMNF
jgi:hypothetical protein